MNGLQIKPSWQPAIEAKRRTFTAFFGPIFPQLKPFHWIYPDTIPFSGTDADFDAIIEPDCLEGYIRPDALLPRFAHFISEDWTDLYGFRERPNIEAVRERLQRCPTDCGWISQNVDLCFFNVDGAYWEIYTKDTNLLEMIRRHVVDLPDITFQERSLSQRESWL